MVAVVEQIRRVGCEDARETTAATSWSVREATTENSVGIGDRGVLVAHFCFVCVVVLGWCLVGSVGSDLIWMNVYHNLLYIEMSSREALVLVSQRNRACDNEFVRHTKNSKTTDSLGQWAHPEDERCTTENEELLSQCH